MNSNGKIYNLDEMAIYLKISISELRKLVRQRSIPYFRIGNRIKFDFDEVNNWIDELKNVQKNEFAHFFN